MNVNVNGIIGKAEEFTDEKGIYILCPNCGGKKYKTGERELMGNIYPSYEDCPICMAERIKKEEQEKIDLNKKIKLDERNKIMNMLESSNIGRKYYSVSFDTLNADISPTFKTAWERLKVFSSPEILPKVMDKNTGFYLYGKNGRGKTALVVAVIKRLIMQGYSCYLTNMIELGQGLINNRVDLEKVKNVDFLVLDDLGTEKLEKAGDTNWLSTQLYDVVTARDKNLKLTVFTSNLSFGDLASNGVEKKTIDRIQALAPVKMLIETPKSYRLEEEREILY